jgi:CHAT domain
MPFRHKNGPPEPSDLSDITPLLSALESPSLDARKSALEALGELKLTSPTRLVVGERIDELLSSAWREADAEWTSSLFSAAARFETPHLTERLHDYASAFDEDQRRVAVYLLAQMHDPYAIDPLVADLDAADPGLQREAASHLVLLDVSGRSDLLLVKIDELADPETRFYLAFAVARSDDARRDTFLDVLSQSGWGADEVFGRISPLGERFHDDGVRDDLDALLPWAAALPIGEKGLGTYDSGAVEEVAPVGERAPAASGERVINAWIDGVHPPATLEVDAPALLKFQIGSPRAGLDITGDRTISDEDVGEGVETEWVVASRGVVLEPVDGDPFIAVNADRGTWTARFTLAIPKDGASDTRSLRIAATTDADPRLNVIVFIRSELYRSIVVKLPLSDAVSNGSLVAEDIAHTPVRHANLLTTHEWTTPPGTLALIVSGGGRAYARGDVRQGDGFTIAEVNEPFDWLGTPAKVAGLITNVRDSAEKLRASAEQYLVTIDASDLRQLLQAPHPQYDWSSLAFTADAAHADAWDAVSCSLQLRDLAVDGARLLNTFFPTGSASRAWLESLVPGWRLDITWLDTDPDWIAQVPWGLMYLGEPPAAGSPVDPMRFLGLRFRLAYSSHRVPGASKALGALANTNRTHFLYWGSGERDVAGVEARRQEQEFAAWANQIFVPPAREPNRKAALLRALETPAPSPVNLLYLFCHCSVGEGNDPVLRFGGSIQPDDVVRRTEFGAAQLADRPLVFANACTTSSADPYVANELQDGFFARGCRAYIGTETKVPIVLASRFATIFFHYLYRRIDPDPMAAGEAMAQTRLFLWTNYLNIGGLFYSYVNQYELFMADDDEVLAMRRPG